MSAQRIVGWMTAVAVCLLLGAWALFWRAPDGGDGLTAREEPFTIYVLGGSTALGDPYAPRADVGRIATFLLGDSLQGRPLRVVNRAGRGKPAAAVIKDAEALARRPPAPGTAAVFLYLGNNEFLGFDRRHDLRQQPRRLFDVAVVSPAEKRQVLQRYEQAVARILETLQAAGYPLVASTAAVNLRDWEPNRSVLTDSLHAPRVQALLLESARLERAGEIHAALEAQREILELEPCFAWACKRAADLLRTVGDFEQARDLYQRAVDCDANPYRELSQQNAILTQVCRRRGVPVVEAVERLAQAAPAGMPGYDLFWDNCHPTLAGYLLIGEGFAEALCQLLSAKVSWHRPALEELEAALGIDRDFERQILHERGQYCYGAATLIFAPAARLARARHYLEAAAGMGPEDADITCSRAVLEALEGDVEASLQLWRRAASLDRDTARQRASNRYVVQIMRRHGVEDVLSRP